MVWVCSTWNYVDLQSGSFLPDIDSFLTAKLNCPHFLVSKTFFTKKGIICLRMLVYRLRVLIIFLLWKVGIKNDLFWTSKIKSDLVFILKKSHFFSALKQSVWGSFPQCTLVKHVWNSLSFILMYWTCIQHVVVEFYFDFSEWLIFTRGSFLPASPLL